MALGLVSPVAAHHSHAMFDHTKQASVSRNGDELRLPQSACRALSRRRERGKKVNYWVEMSNVQNMIRRGIGHGTFKPGDKVTVTLHPLKDGRPGGNYIKVVAADGKTYE